jgi:hypothetical protein
MAERFHLKSGQVWRRKNNHRVRVKIIFKWVDGSEVIVGYL